MSTFRTSDVNLGHLGAFEHSEVQKNTSGVILIIKTLGEDILAGTPFNGAVIGQLKALVEQTKEGIPVDL
jgi:hypothetical protein